MKKAKAAARRLGLAYWPALIDRFSMANPPWSCDPKALVVAEKVLSRFKGLWGEVLPNGQKSHGGWDSCGVWGINADHVAQMWLAAGCRNSAKFRLQVAASTRARRLDDRYRWVARKGDSLPWLRNYYRGLGWLVANNIELPLSRDSIAALGRISPEGRRAALKKFFSSPPDWSRKIRPRHLDWEAARNLKPPNL